jgi:hypothetical protein
MFLNNLLNVVVQIAKIKSAVPHSLSYNKKESVVRVRARTIPTELPLLVGEGSASFS